MANRPNIIFYFTDQQRADTCGCYGQKLDITPRLDQLASEGVKFERAFSPQPVCPHEKPAMSSSGMLRSRI